MNPGENPRGDSNLQEYGYDLVGQAGTLDPVVGRHDEITRLIGILAKKDRNSPLLVGEPGVGKTAIVNGLATRIASGDVPSCLNGVQVIALHTQALAAGDDEYKGGLLKAVLQKVEERELGVILFMDEIHLLVGACASMDAATLLTLILDRDRLRCIGTTTTGMFRKHAEEFERYFQQVFVAELSVCDTISVLRGLKQSYEAYHGINILDGALVAAAQLSSGYMTGYQPDKAIGLIDEACAKVLVHIYNPPKEIDDLERRITHLKFAYHALEEEKDKASEARLLEVKEELRGSTSRLEQLMIKYDKEKEKREEASVVLQEADVTRALKSKLGAVQNLDENLMAVGSAARLTLRGCDQPWLIGLAERLRDRVVEQDEAVNAVADAILKSRAAAFGKANQPRCWFLFVGPTVVGKTELAKAISKELFDDDDDLPMITINMFLYAEEQLIGSPPRFVGRVREAVKRRPNSVVLFDKVEKAHPSVLNTMLRMFDDGSTVDFTNTVIIMTCKIGAKYLLTALAEKAAMDNARLQVMQEVRRQLKPELLDRADKIVVFNPLSHAQLRKVVRIQLKDIAIRLAEQGVALGVTEAALDVVIPESYDLVDGAEPGLKKNIVTGLAMMLMRREIDEQSTVYVDADANGKDFSYSVERDGIQKSNILIQVPITTRARSDAWQAVKKQKTR